MVKTVNNKDTHCPFCAGASPIEDIDHVVSKSMFFKFRPQGFEFGTCKACNSGTKRVEAQLAYIGSAVRHVGDPANVRWEEKYNIATRGMGEHAQKLKEYLRANSAGEIGKAIEESALFEGFRQAVEVYTAKLAAAIYRYQFDRILPSSGGVYVFWTTALENGKSDRFFDNLDFFPKDRKEWAFNRQGNSQNSASGEHIFEYAVGEKRSIEKVDFMKVSVEWYGWIRAVVLVSSDLADPLIKFADNVGQPVKPPFRCPEFKFSF